MTLNTLVAHLELTGTWDFTYTASIDRGAPEVPARDRFDVEIPVAGYWDDCLDRLQAGAFWSDAEFNADHTPVEYSHDHPHDEQDAGLPYLKGVGWYRKCVDVPADWRDRQVFLRLGPVRLEAWIWVNGRRAGYHQGHSTAFGVKIDAFLDYGGVNEIVIAVSNLRPGVSGCDLRGYKGKTGGMFQTPCLKVTGKTSIADVHVHPTAGRQRIRCMAELGPEPMATSLWLEWRISNPQDNSTITTGSIPVSGRQAVWEIERGDMTCWSDEHPVLYDIVFTLRDGDSILDERRQSLGLRRFEARGVKIYLNDRPTFLRGVTEHCYFPLDCTPPRDIEEYRRVIRSLKRLGFNWIRFHTWTPPEPYLQAADEVGMMLQVELPVNGTMQEWDAIILGCRKHPSVVIYCCGNEELLDEEKIEKLRAFAVRCRELAPDALFNPQEALRGIEYSWNDSDLGAPTTDEPFLHNPQRLEAIKQFSDVFGQYAWGYLSYVSNLASPAALDKRMSIYEKPCLSHEMGIHGTYINLDLECRYETSRIGGDLYRCAREYLRDMGLLDKAPTYFQNSCAWARTLRKYSIEKARRCRYLAGYDYLGPIDQHWHRKGYHCGVMDEFYELKPGESVGDVLKYNGADVLLLDYDANWNLQAGDTFEADVLVSLFGTRSLENATLCWQLVDSDGTCRVSEEAVVSADQGTLSKLQTTSFVVPELAAATAMKLQVRLADPSRTLENDWDFWVFPSVASVDIDACVAPAMVEHLECLPHVNCRNHPDSDLLITLTLDATAREFLQAGKEVLLLGGAPLPVLSTSFQSIPAGRARGNLATIVNEHPALADFPHAGYCHWQFRPLLDGGRAIVFNDLDITFNPIIEVVSTYKLILKQAALFELRVGSGKLVVCTLNLFADDPAARHLLRTLVDYIQSPTCTPIDSITLAQLTDLIERTHPSYQGAETDMAFDPNAQI